MSDYYIKMCDMQPYAFFRGVDCVNKTPFAGGEHIERVPAIELMSEAQSEIDQLKDKVSVLAEVAESKQESIDQLKAQVERLSGEAKRLWCLLDDVSTYGDMYKPEITGYFKAVNRKCEERNGMIESDGYKLFIKEGRQGED